MHLRKTTPTLRSLFLVIALIVSLAACGSDDDSGAPVPDGSDAGSDQGDDPSAPAPADNPDGGDGTGTLTMTDGTTYEFAMTSCDTTDNASGFLIDDGYDVFGKTPNGEFSTSLNRAGFSEDSVTAVATLEGDFDEDGRNARIIYANEVDGIDLTVDGSNVTGTVAFKAIGPPGPHGEQTEATVDVRCGG